MKITKKKASEMTFKELPCGETFLWIGCGDLNLKAQDNYYVNLNTGYVYEVDSADMDMKVIRQYAELRYGSEEF